MLSKLVENVSLRVRLIAGFGIVLFLTWILGAAALQRIAGIYDITQTVYEHPLAVSNAALEVKVAVWRLDGAVNDLLLAETPARTEEVVRQANRVRAAIGPQMRLIESQFLGSPKDVAEVYASLENWYRTFDELAALVKAGKTAEARKLHELRVSELETGFDREINDIIFFARNKAASLSKQALAHVDDARTVLFLLLLVLTAIGGLTAALIVRGITGPLATLRECMVRLAGGDLDHEVPFRRLGNELGRMAQAVQVFKESAQRLEDQRWVKSHVADISAALQVADSPQSFARALLDRLVPLLGDGIGVCSILEEESGRFVLAGRYGCGPDLSDDHSFSPGEGLAGQCAQSRRNLFLTEVPDDYFRIASALGGSKPVTLALLPVASQNMVAAVIEVGGFAPLRSLQLEFLEELLPAVALNLEIMTRNLKTRHLLRQTRQQAAVLTESEARLARQAEDLQEVNAQLRMQTEELETQTEELQASDEELRVQQEQLRAVNDQMAEKNRLLEDQATALRIAQAEAEQRAVELTLASRYKSEFLANMSHELRTPLNSLLILAKSLAGNQEGNLTADQVESAEIIRDSGVQLLSLINDILDIAKVESGKMRVALQDTALPGLADTVSRRFKGMARVKGLDYRVVLAPDLPDIIRTDGGKVEQILNNLVGNAIKFTERGSVTVTFCRHLEGSVPNPAGIKGDVVAVSVVDTGIGISENLVDRIFLAFEQGEGATNRRYGGTGLGLSIARKLARLLGGDIYVHSVEGEGSSFTLVIPVTAPAAPVAEPVARAAGAARPVQTSAPVSSAPPLADDREAIRPGDRVMLVIEDDPRFARIVSGIVRDKGFKCLVAGDGESGVALAARHRPVGIVLDVGLPGLDGWGVIERLRSQPLTRDIPVHVMSASDFDVRAREMGAIGFLAKPASEAQIGEAIARVAAAGGGTLRRLMIAHADPEARKALGWLVEADEVEVVEIADGDAVAARLRAEAVDCLVYDVDLPGGGTGLLEKLGRERSEGLPPLIVISSRELSLEETIAFRAFTDAIIVRSDRSDDRLLNEIRLFLHSVGARIPGGLRPPFPVAVSEDTALAGRTVLVVDDDMRNSFALSKVLRSRGLRVLLAQDGRKALAQLDGNPAIELVVMDIMMPGMDGYQTMREIRKDARWATLPIIAVTAKAMMGDRERCVEAGASSYLAKPVDTDELLQLMTGLIGG